MDHSENLQRIVVVQMDINTMLINVNNCVYSITVANSASEKTIILHKVNLQIIVVVKVDIKTMFVNAQLWCIFDSVLETQLFYTAGIYVHLFSNQSCAP